MSGKVAATAATYSKIAAKHVSQLPETLLNRLSDPSEEKVNVLVLINEEQKKIDQEFREEVGDDAAIEEFFEHVEKTKTQEKIIDLPVVESIAWGRIAAL
jgi:hypothetical protein